MAGNGLIVRRLRKSAREIERTAEERTRRLQIAFAVSMAIPTIIITAGDALYDWIPQCHWFIVAMIIIAGLTSTWVSVAGNVMVGVIYLFDSYKSGIQKVDEWADFGVGFERQMKRRLGNRYKDMDREEMGEKAADWCADMIEKAPKYERALDDMVEEPDLGDDDLIPWEPGMER